jgi:transcriptional regulator with XRE-family HTH domain
MSRPKGYETQSPIPANPATLGERLRWLRKQRGLTQVELAEAIGCEQTMVSSWEGDRTRPTAATLLTLARFHHLPLEVVAGGEGFLGAATAALETIRAKGHARTAKRAAAEVRLEPPPFGQVVMMDLAKDATTATDLADAQMQFLRAVQKGRDVWIVVR